MSNKQINSTWYSYDKFDIRDHKLVNCRLPNNCLWSKSKYKTTITAKDLPLSFIYGRYYKRWGYIDTANVKDILYIPNKFTNHFLKDDCLLIAYDGKIEKSSDDCGIDFYRNESHRIYGSEIINILKGVREFSHIDISIQISQLKDKVLWLKNNYPNYFSEYTPDIDKIFCGPISRYDYHYDNEEI